MCGMDYAGIVPTTVGTGRENPMHVRRTSATKAFFLRLQFINGGRCGETERSAGVLTGRFLTPAFVRRLRCEKRNGGLQSVGSPAMNHPAYRRALRLSRRIPNSGPRRAKAVHAWSAALIAALKGRKP